MGEKNSTSSNASNSSSQNKEENIKVTTPTLTNAFGGGNEANLNVISDGAYGTETSWNTVSGWKLYEKVGTNYNLVKAQTGLNNIKVTVDVWESKTYVARVYVLNKSGKKVYSGYSNEIIVE